MVPLPSRKMRSSNKGQETVPPTWGERSAWPPAANRLAKESKEKVK